MREALHERATVWRGDRRGGHVIENDREIWKFLPAPYKGQEQLFGMPFFPTLDGFHRAARSVGDGKGRVLEIPTHQDWQDYLASANIAASVLLPTSGLAFGMIGDVDWAEALARAYNDYVYDTYLKHDPVRLKGLALIPVQDPRRAVKELDRAVRELGFVGAILPGVGLYEAFGHKMYWPVYEAAQDLNTLLAVHGGPSIGIGVDRFHKLIEIRTLNHLMPQLVQMTSMMFGGVYDAFPTLRVAYMEAGCGWVPYLKERLDRTFSGRGAQVPDVKALPSEHLKSGRIFLHTELNEEGLGYAASALRDDIFFCASDFPHEPKEDFPEEIEHFEDRTDISDDLKKNTLWNTPLRMYNLDEAALRAASERTQLAPSA